MAGASDPILARRALALDHVGDGVVVVDREDRVLDWTPSAERMYGFTAAEADGRVLHHLVRARILEGDLAGIMTRMEGGIDRHVVESVHRRADGAELEVEVVATAVRGSDGLEAYVLVIRDVGERRRAARALRESEEWLSRALAASDMDFWDFDARRGAFVIGPRWAARLGIPARFEGGIEAALVHLCLPEEAARVAAESRARLMSGHPWETEHRARAADGTLRWIQVRGQTTERAPDGRPFRFSGTMRDVTEAKALRTVLERTERLAALGTLAAGVAHEVNNPLAYVGANLQFVRDALQPGALPPEALREVRGAVEEAIGGTARVREIVAGLEQFAVPAARTPGPVDVRAELLAAVGMTRNEIAHRARLVVELPEALPAVTAGPAELGQVFVNLLVNAAQAIPDGAADAEVRLAARAEGARVMIEVRDSGVGIPPHLLAQVFDPFFTTKAVGAGTGLGLSVCHGIVNAAGGTIEVESVPSRGSTFRVILPAAATAPAPARAAPDAPPAPPAPPAPSRGRLLIVDDEPLVGRALARLVASSHDVVVVTSGADALARLEAGEPYDLVLCDLMMPGLSGMELEARVAQAVPALVGRLVYMTGGAFTPAARAFLEAGRPFLEKPIDAAALRTLLAERLARAG
jgi:PAS domain S-box-containing protein